MKLPAVLLTVSVLANAVLVAVLVSTRQAEDSSGAAPGSSAADPAVRVVDAGAQSPTFAAQGGETGLAATPDTDGSARLVALAVGGDLSALARTLRSGGIPEEAVRGIIRELLGLRQRDRLVQLLAGGDADQPYWQLDPRSRPTPEVRAEIRRLQRELQEELDRLLGPAPVTLGRASRYGFLDEGKRTLLEQIDSDYNEMIREVREDMAGFPLRSDQETLRLLAEERQRDIDALLTPEEREAVDLRLSSTASRVRSLYGSILQSEDEYRAVFSLYRSLDEQFSGADADRRRRAEAEAALRTQVMEMLGPGRAAVFARQQDPDFRTLQAATQRLNLPARVTDDILSLRAQTAAESQRITADAALGPAEQRRALARLSERVRAELTAKMGPEGADAFVERTSWVRALEQGRSFTERPAGGVSVQGGGDATRRARRSGPPGGP